MGDCSTTTNRRHNQDNTIQAAKLQSLAEQGAFQCQNSAQCHLWLVVSLTIICFSIIYVILNQPNHKLKHLVEIHAIQKVDPQPKWKFPNKSKRNFPNKCSAPTKLCPKQALAAQFANGTIPCSPGLAADAVLENIEHTEKSKGRRGKHAMAAVANCHEGKKIIQWKINMQNNAKTKSTSNIHYYLDGNKSI